MILPGLFDKFVENVYKFFRFYSILLVFAYDTGQYVYDRYCKFLRRKSYTCFTNIW